MNRCIWCTNLLEDDAPVCADCEREIGMPFIVPQGQDIFEALAHALRRQLETQEIIQ